MTLFWLILAVAMAVVEALTVQLVSIWFAAGAVAACIASLFSENILVQVGVFVAVSAVALLVTRPLVSRMKKHGTEATNADKYIGMSGVTLSEIDNEKAAGQVRVGSSVWSAKSADGFVIPPDTKIKVRDIQGVKLIVEPENAPEN